MPDSSQNNSLSENNQPKLPPMGDKEKAEKYVNQLLALIEKDLIVVEAASEDQKSQSVPDHYFVNLDQYKIDFSQNQHEDEDSYLMTFSKPQASQDGTNPPATLAILYLSKEQFEKLKNASKTQIERIKKEKEEKRFSESMAPIDQLLSQISSQPKRETDVSLPAPQTVPEANLQQSAPPAIKPVNNIPFVSQPVSPQQPPFLTQTSPQPQAAPQPNYYPQNPPMQNPFVPNPPQTNNNPPFAQNFNPLNLNR